MKLFGYSRSNAAFRVRIALNLKQMDYDPVSVDLAKGEQTATAYKALNPQGLVPTIVDGPAILTQSIALIEYLDEVSPEPHPLLPHDPAGRARVRGLALGLTTDVHPLITGRVRRQVMAQFNADQDGFLAWTRHWITEGFQAFEAALGRSDDTGRFCHGHQPTMADICLVPEYVYADRIEVDLSAFPKTSEIAQRCLEMNEFASARPERQPDFE